MFGDQIVSYAWDLRADDSYEYTSSNPTTTVPWTQLSGLTPGLDYAVRLRVTDTFRATGTSDTTFRIATPTDLAFQPGSCTGTYGETTSLIVKLTTGLVAVPNETVIFRLNGSNVGFATTDAYGIATLTQVSLTGLDAGTYTSYVVASFLSETRPVWQAPPPLTSRLVKATADILVTGYTGVYDAAATGRPARPRAWAAWTYAGLNLGGASPTCRAGRPPGRSRAARTTWTRAAAWRS